MPLKSAGLLTTLLAVTLVSTPLVPIAHAAEPPMVTAARVVPQTFLLINGVFVDVTAGTTIDYDDGHVYVNAAFVGTLHTNGNLYDLSGNLVGYIVVPPPSL